jgi:hypothetical protein
MYFFEHVPQYFIAHRYAHLILILGTALAQLQMGFHTGN